VTTVVVASSAVTLSVAGCDDAIPQDAAPAFGHLMAALESDDPPEPPGDHEHGGDPPPPDHEHEDPAGGPEYLPMTPPETVDASADVDAAAPPVRLFHPGRPSKPCVACRTS
jgi:hypothetical protein